MANETPVPDVSHLAAALESITNDLQHVSKDDLGELAKRLAESGLDQEKLIRLSKLAAKATANSLGALGGPVKAYHY